ncbi:iron-sulfur cluster assembly 2 homolog, mitochondrial-like [Oppia nitens]|uniref:iron-sulfur cluster assembly 2 homolog, mitochondrial-like n=1 Tax=Oppia nitens TaxID=1686743 RepID=UPI0023DB56F7|nr:iron-sulfur cluster assembly 2 homolog, mitochondrial-like [Oppia nitens]
MQYIWSTNVCLLLRTVCCLRNGNHFAVKCITRRSLTVAMTRKASIKSMALSATTNGSNEVTVNGSQQHHNKLVTDADNRPMITISDSCVERLKKVMDKSDDILRVEVFSGGCSGLQYKFDITDKVNEDDHIIERNGVKVVVDGESIQFLKGSTIDYTDELIKSSFRVINNPQSEQGCSCGQSFALKLDNDFKKFKT